MTITEKLRALITINAEIEKQGIQTMVPCLVGWTGEGKTTIWREIAEELGLPLKRILLHSMLVEEVLGLPRVVDERTVWSIPDWVGEEPCLYLFDEVDKVQKEELGGVLTLFADKVIRNIRLPEGSIIGAAMQPIPPVQWEETETGRALIARLNFIPMNGEGKEFLKKKYSLSLDWYPEAKEIQIPRLPRPAPRQIQYAIEVMKRSEHAEELLRGVLAPEVYQALKEDYTGSWRVDAQVLCEHLNQHPEDIEKLTIPELQQFVGELWMGCRPNVLALAEARILIESSPEDWIT
ncbi:MAG: AAA family ATPase, partial [Candidatus Kapaibacteriota bacterium]